MGACIKEYIIIIIMKKTKNSLYSWTIFFVLFFLGCVWSVSGRGGKSTTSKLAKLFLLKESDKMEKKLSPRL